MTDAICAAFRLFDGIWLKTTTKLTAMASTPPAQPGNLFAHAPHRHARNPKTVTISAGAGKPCLRGGKEEFAAARPEWASVLAREWQLVVEPQA